MRPVLLQQDSPHNHRRRRSPILIAPADKVDRSAPRFMRGITHLLARHARPPPRVVRSWTPGGAARAEALPYRSGRERLANQRPTIEREHVAEPDAGGFDASQSAARRPRIALSGRKRSSRPRWLSIGRGADRAS